MGGDTDKIFLIAFSRGFGIVTYHTRVQVLLTHLHLLATLFLQVNVTRGCLFDLPSELVGLGGAFLVKVGGLVQLCGVKFLVIVGLNAKELLVDGKLVPLGTTWNDLSKWN